MLAVSVFVMRILHPDFGPVLSAAAEGTPASGPTAGLVQYGAIGIVASAAIAGLIWFVKQQAAELKARSDAMAEAYRLAIARGDRLEGENRDLNRRHAEDIREMNRAHADEIRELHRKNVDTVIPALSAAQEASRDMQELARDQQELMRDLARGGTPK